MQLFRLVRSAGGVPIPGAGLKAPWAVVSADPTGAWFTFEKGAAKSTGGQGWADVWRKHAFAWEYKGKHRDLDAAGARAIKNTTKKLN